MRNRVVIGAGSGGVAGKRAVRALRRALIMLGEDKVFLWVGFLSDAYMKKLNTAYRGKNRATNVLSFEPVKRFPNPEVPKRFTDLGEICLAPSYIRARKEDMGALAVHGLLHLLGYTHAKKRDRIRMEKVEERLLRNVKHHHWS